LLEWLSSCGVWVNVFDNDSAEDWEINRAGLLDINDGDYDKLSGYIVEEVKELISDLLQSNGESNWVYLSWW
jgi:hypothetical protein